LRAASASRAILAAAEDGVLLRPSVLTLMLVASMRLKRCRQRLNLCWTRMNFSLRVAMGPFFNRLWVLLLGFGLCAASIAKAEERVVLYGDASYPPYSFVEGGQFKGIYVNILTKAAERLKPQYVVELVPVPWKRGLLYLERGSGLGLFPPGFKKERGYIETYSVPLYQETVVIFCSDKVMGANPQQFPEDFKGMTMGINRGFLLSDRLMQAVQRGLVKTEEASGNDSNLQKLAHNRIDCYVSDRGAALYSAKLLRETDASFTMTLHEAVVLSDEETFIGYSAKANPPYKADFIKKMDAALGEMRNNGEIEAIVADFLR
jgi:polar amino acid transport system substrate-binding protein